MEMMQLRRYLVFILISITLILSAIGATSVSVAFPSITQYYKVSLVIAGWIIVIYQLALTVVMPLVGKVSDAWGRKFTFILCLLFFTAGSFLCAISPNIYILIVSRLLQALGGGGFMPIATGLVADMFPEARQKMIGFLSSIFPIGQIIGPNLGGWLVSAYGWQSVFWINIPFGILIFLAILILLKPDAKKEQKTEIDFKGSLILGVAVASFLVSLSVLGDALGKGIVWALLLGVIALVFIILFVRHEKNVSNPIIELEILREKPFMAANIFNFFYGMAFIGIMSLIPAYAVEVYHMTILESGLLLTPRSVGMVLASFITSVYLVKWGYRWPMVVGTIGAVLGLFLLSIEFANTFWLYLIMLALGIAAGVTAPASNNACIELMPERVSTITGVRGMFRQLGGAISVNIATLIINLSPNPFYGFRIVFIGLSLLLLLTFPAIWVMPSSPLSPVCKTSG
jgi:EmrB/QacA subfamily drug resistance transporter